MPFDDSPESTATTFWVRPTLEPGGDDRSMLERMAAMPEKVQEEFLSSLSKQEAADLERNWRGWLARPKQLLPPMESSWFVWVFLGGRGCGKTRSGAEAVKELVEVHGYTRIALIGDRYKDITDVMLGEFDEGADGLFSLYANHGKGSRPKYNKTEHFVQYPAEMGGAKLYCVSSRNPDAIRGLNVQAAWCDELAKWPYATEAWAMLDMALRKKLPGVRKPSRVYVSTTPRPTHLMRSIRDGKEGNTFLSVETMDRNRNNLDDSFKDRMRAKYKGRLGRQELNAEILDDYVDGLWKRKWFKHVGYHEFHGGVDPDTKVDHGEGVLAKMGRIVVGVDPAVSSGDTANEHGIYAVGVTQDGRDLYVIRDYSLTGSPNDWGQAAVKAYDKYGADLVVAEVNNGGDMVEHTLKTVRPGLPVKQVRASRGKHVRAQPLSALYQEGRVFHVGEMEVLEAQMLATTTAGYQKEHEHDSPDHMDSVVWAATELMPEIRGHKDEPAKALDTKKRRRGSRRSAGRIT